MTHSQLTTSTAHRTAAQRLAHVADQLGRRDLTPRRFLRGLAWNCAGIRPDLRGYLDLAVGGRNPISGRGFRRRFDDGTDGQVRHFAGVAVAPVLLGDRFTGFALRWFLRDSPDSADGRLSEAALRFAHALRSGEVSVRDAGSWIRQNLVA
ncbi:hypothetical protein [Naasia lichenicola]|uniref:Uncharacterized protein n=1 Tax=Naasia lichenicola TaxID=2565933 RepID=A0A4S4FKR2_9MICO|nr:hypothetical protein [Naasia lichenicola]THG29885.1 hypothetical protein E6C64_14640 [Naasia lichenicola]